MRMEIEGFDLDWSFRWKSRIIDGGVAGFDGQVVHYRVTRKSERPERDASWMRDGYWADRLEDAEGRRQIAILRAAARARRAQLWYRVQDWWDRLIDRLLSFKMPVF